MSQHRHLLTRALPTLGAIAAIALIAAACGGSSNKSSTPTSAAAGSATSASSPTSAPSSAATSAPSAAATSAPTQAPSAAASAAPSSAAPASTTIALTEKDTKFDKSTITVPAGAMVTVNVTNDDAIIHNFAVYDTKGGTELYTGPLFKGPNVTKSDTFKAPAKAGNYYFQCDVHPDQMNGTLVVQ